MGCGHSKPLSCPKCDYTFINAEDFLFHLERQHGMQDAQNLQCPKCKERFKDTSMLAEHLEKTHSDAHTSAYITCPKCTLKGFKDGAALINHCEREHTQTVPRQVHVKQSSTQGMPEVELSVFEQKPTVQSIPIKVGNKSFPGVGDKVLAMWSHSQWQYFHATVRRFIPNQLQFEIDWDDPDPTGRIVDYFNLALDKSPNPKDISVGSIILFPQGKYVGGPNGGTYGGVRWHQGRITQIHDRPDGSRLFDGCHTKGDNDGKWITYSGYEYTFQDYELEKLRIGPNVFDILDDNNCTDADVSEDDIDVYFSYTPSDSLTAIKNKETSNVPEKYAQVIDRFCDPQDIVNNLKSKGLKVGVRKAKNSEELRKTATMMKRAKVFIACISDEYVANDECRMEFQYAKTTLNTPIVPLVVGDGSFDWTVSVVGMLVAGELYIHFKDKSVEQAKFTELTQALKAHFDKITDAVDAGSAGLKVEGPADIFISYSWANSFRAKEAQQVSNLVGTKLSDPRLIEDELEDRGFKTWVDIERLRSANASAGMYEQLTAALKEAKVVIPFVSNEYANSPNCRMEFQFAMKSLNKPIIPIIVGDGDDWKTSVIGALVTGSDRDPIDLQNINNQQVFNQRIEELISEINNIFGNKSSPSGQKKKVAYRAPRVGDHVVSHHVQCAYYMATIVSFDSQRLEYTVNWDDGDPTGRIQAYDQVALDIVPDPDDVGEGSIIFFPQGAYGGTVGNNTGGERYHQGVVTECKRNGKKVLVSGNHTKGEADGKWVTYRGYAYNFDNIALEHIRIAPSAMDALLAAKA